MTAGARRMRLWDILNVVVAVVVDVGEQSSKDDVRNAGIARTHPSRMVTNL